MSSIGGFDKINSQLKEYKRKYYLNALIRGALLFLGLATFLFLFLTTLEYFGRFSTLFRAIFLFLFFITILGSLFQLVGIPLWKSIYTSKGITDEQAAYQIGNAFPEIKDKLLNALQLKQLNPNNSDLILASIVQRTDELKWYRFPKAIKFSENQRFLKYFLAPVFVVGIIAFFIPNLFSESTERLINYKKEFVPTAPYSLEILNDNLNAFKNEDFELNVKFSGQLIPESSYIISGDRRVRMKRKTNGSFSFTWRKIQQDENFKISAAGFSSESYILNVLARPELSSFELYIDYPDYTGLVDESLKNIGDLSAPEGTKIKWLLQTQQAKTIDLQVNSNTELIEAPILQNTWTYTRLLKESFDYSIALNSAEGIKRELLSYTIEAVPDAFPAISVKQAYDSSLYNYVVVGGSVQDDYGLSKLQIFYSVFGEDNSILQQSSIPIALTDNLKKQNFIYNWDFKDIDLKSGQRLEYFVQVTDNDGFNGVKSTRSNPFIIKIPSEEDIRESINENSKSMQSEMTAIQEEARQLNEELKEIMDETKAKKSLEWKDKNKIDQALKKHDELKKELEKLNKDLDKNTKTKNRFEEPNDKIQQKTESLKNLMNELLDEETKELLKELQKLLEEKGDNQQIQNDLKELENKSYNLEKELDRAIEMFKQLQYEERMNKAIEKLEELSEKQEKLSEDTENKSLSNKELQKEQEEINKEFEKLSEELEDIKDLDESMENPNNMESTEEEESEIEKSLEESSDQLEKNKNSKASESQKKSSQKMDDMAKKMSDFMMNMSSQSLMEDMNNLRQILENLITLSFEQEDLMNEFKKVNQSDPRYVELGQEQLKLKDDAKIIEDSLYALAKRVFQIESFVTREVNDMNKNMDDALQAIKDRKNGLAAGKQQFAMTSINNLALMLNDVLKQMQEQMASQMEGDQMCSKPKKGGKPSMSMLQQSLNQKIRELKQSGKQGRELSEGLAELAREQEELREMLEGMGSGESQLDKNAQDKLNELEKIMEESEKDLVHKRLTQELLQRQEDILTRLLESEKAQREQQLDPKRESQTANKLERTTPPDLEKYFEEKEKQTELLKTISPFLNSYYRERVNEYFEKIYE